MPHAGAAPGPELPTGVGPRRDTRGEETTCVSREASAGEEQALTVAAVQMQRQQSSAAMITTVSLSEE